MRSWNMASQLLLLDFGSPPPDAYFPRSSYVTLLASTAWSRRIVKEGRDAHSLQTPASQSRLPADAVQLNLNL
jgi:hypothetical protein